MWALKDWWSFHFIYFAISPQQYLRTELWLESSLNLSQIVTIVFNKLVRHPYMTIYHLSENSFGSKNVLRWLRYNSRRTRLWQTLGHNFLCFYAIAIKHWQILELSFTYNTIISVVLNTWWPSCGRALAPTILLKLGQVMNYVNLKWF